MDRTNTPTRLPSIASSPGSPASPVFTPPPKRPVRTSDATIASANRSPVPGDHLRDHHPPAITDIDTDIDTDIYIDFEVNIEVHTDGETTASASSSASSSPAAAAPVARAVAVAGADGNDEDGRRKASYACEMCGERFNFERYLNLHVRQLHDRLPVHHCPHCRNAYGRVKDLNDHIHRAHPTAGTVTSGAGNTVRRNIRRAFSSADAEDANNNGNGYGCRRRRAAACPHCPCSFLSDISLRQHMNSAHRRPLHRCPCAPCEFQAVYAGTLKQHLIDVHNIAALRAYPVDRSFAAVEKRTVGYLALKSSKSSSTRALAHMHSNHLPKRMAPWEQQQKIHAAQKKTHMEPKAKPPSEKEMEMDENDVDATQINVNPVVAVGATTITQRYVE